MSTCPSPGFVALGRGSGYMTLGHITPLASPSAPSPCDSQDSRDFGRAYSNSTAGSCYPSPRSRASSRSLSTISSRSESCVSGGVSSSRRSSWASSRRSDRVVPVPTADVETPHTLSAVQHSDVDEDHNSRTDLSSDSDNDLEFELHTSRTRDAGRFPELGSGRRHLLSRRGSGGLSELDATKLRRVSVAPRPDECQLRYL
eukprot:Selendium_serpulae@DN9655_c0_g1_i1.p1